MSIDRRNILALICFYLVIGSIYGQSKVIVDDATNLPIRDVFVYIDNSSIGMVSDSDGKYKLDVTDFEGADIVFSHVGYDLYRIVVDQIYRSLDTIRLTEFVNEVSEVQIVGSKDPSIRRKRLKRFSDAFLGENQKSKLIKVLNEDDIILYDKSGHLLASCSSPVIIENLYTGYTIHFTIEQFDLYPSGKLILRGSTFFQSVEGSKREEARFKKNRMKTYLKSAPRFFKSLYDGALDNLDYEIGFSNLEENTFTTTKKIKLEDLKIKEISSDVKSIDLQGFLVILAKTVKIYAEPLGKNKGLQETAAVDKLQLARSFICSRTNQIFVDKNGQIRNPEDTEEYGYWAEKRMAHILPFDYGSNE